MEYFTTNIPDRKTNALLKTEHTVYKVKNKGESVNAGMNDKECASFINGRINYNPKRKIYIHGS